MTQAIDTHCETALDSPYSRDREEAIEELVRLVPEVSESEQRRVFETLRQVAREATGTQERELARESLVEAFEAAPDVGASVVVPFFCEHATDGTHSDDRLAAIDTLRRLYPDVGSNEQDEIGRTLAEIAGNATYEDERRRARQRLSDVTAENERRSATDDDPDGESIRYLGQSLAEHLANAADGSPEACLQRAEEMQDFVAANPLDDESYQDVCDDIEALTEQLSVLRSDELDTERRERVRRIANRIERLYKRK